MSEESISAPIGDVVNPPPAVVDAPPEVRPLDGFDRLVPTKNPPALIAYYLSVFSLIPCAALLLGPAAVIFGLVALKVLKVTPTLPGKTHALVGVVLGSLTSVLNIAAIAFTAANTKAT